MEYQKIANSLDNNLSNQTSKFRTKNWVEINDESKESYSGNSDIRFTTTMLRSNLCDYADAYVLVKGTITLADTSAVGAAANNTNKKVIFKNCAPFTNCISEINNTQVDNAKDIDIVMPMYNVIEYSGNYLKTCGSLWQYFKDVPAVHNSGNIVEFNGANVTDSFNFKAKMAGQTDNDGKINDVEIMVPLKYFSNFWRTLELFFTNCEINLILSWSVNCVIVYTDVANQGAKSAITDTKLYVPLNSR